MVRALYRVRRDALRPALAPATAQVLHERYNAFHVRQQRIDGLLPHTLA